MEQRAQLEEGGRYNELNLAGFHRQTCNTAGINARRNKEPSETNNHKIPLFNFISIHAEQKWYSVLISEI